jgi:hypothetical protein
VWLHNDYARPTHKNAWTLYRAAVTNLPLTGVQDGALDGAGPQLTFVTKLCGAGSCPTVYRTDRDTFVIQGYTVTAEAAGLDLPLGEQLVEIPAELLAEAVRAAN